MGIRIAVIGGASNYTPELFAELLDHPEWPKVDQVTLMDPNIEKLAFITSVCERLLEKAQSRIRVRSTNQREEAIKRANFIILQIRVGGLSARIRDEKLPMEFGMIGNETTGAGGFVCALRTVPVALDIARDIERLAPQAWLLNLSNPAGIVTEALIKHAQVRTVGFCNIPINTTYHLAEVFGVDPTKISLDSFGLNHLSWVRKALVDGEDLLQPLIAEARSRDADIYQKGLVETLIDPSWLRTLSMLPSWYLRYFYYPDQILEEDQRTSFTKGEKDIETEEQLRQIYNVKGYGEETRRILKAKGGAQYYLPVLQVVDSIVNDKGDVIVVDVANGVALPDLPPEVCVEVPARIYNDRIEPLSVGRMPLVVRGLVQAVKTYEELAIESAITGDRQIALAAMTVHPLVGTYSKAKPFFDRVLENERSYLPKFFK